MNHGDGEFGAEESCRWRVERGLGCSEPLEIVVQSGGASFFCPGKEGLSLVSAYYDWEARYQAFDHHTLQPQPYNLNRTENPPGPRPSQNCIAETHLTTQSNGCTNARPRM